MFSSNPGLVLYNLGVRGDKVQQVEQRLEAEFRCRGELRNRTPDGILLSVGLNDSAQLGRSYGRNMTDLEQFQQQMADLLTQARQLCPVWMIGAPPINEDKMPFAGCLYYSHREQYRYKEVTRQLCQQQQIPYLDIFDQWLSQGTAWWQSRLCDDGIHPNVLGYETLLETITAWQPLMDFALEAA
jgi:lysophospholipase L1-like esterase